MKSIILKDDAGSDMLIDPTGVGDANGTLNDRGFGFDIPSSELGSDANNYIHTGIYYCALTENAAITNPSYLLVFNASESRKMQIQTRANLTTSKEVYMRKMNNGTWGDWYQINFT